MGSGGQKQRMEIFSKFVDSHRSTLKEIKKRNPGIKIGLTLEKGGDDRWSGKNGRR